MKRVKECPTMEQVNVVYIPYLSAVFSINNPGSITLYSTHIKCIELAWIDFIFFPKAMSFLTWFCIQFDTLVAQHAVTLISILTKFDPKFLLFFCIYALNRNLLHTLLSFQTINNNLFKSFILFFFYNFRFLIIPYYQGSRK